MRYWSYRRNADEDLQKLKNRYMADGTITDSELEQLERAYRRGGRYRCVCLADECNDRCLETITIENGICSECIDEYHWPHAGGCSCILCQVPIYKGLIELHANYTIFDPRMSKVDLDMIFWVDLVNREAEEFREQTGVKVFFEGRSGRHVCVEDTFENRLKYDELRQTALEMEESVILAYLESHTDEP